MQKLTLILALMLITLFAFSCDPMQGPGSGDQTRTLVISGSGARIDPATTNLYQETINTQGIIKKISQVKIIGLETSIVLTGSVSTIDADEVTLTLVAPDGDKYLIVDQQGDNADYSGDYIFHIDNSTTIPDPGDNTKIPESTYVFADSTINSDISGEDLNGNWGIEATNHKALFSAYEFTDFEITVLYE